MAIVYHTDLNGIKEMIAWLLTGIFLLAGFRFFKTSVAFLLMKLYDLFITGSPVKP